LHAIDRVGLERVSELGENALSARLIGCDLVAR